MGDIRIEGGGGQTVDYIEELVVRGAGGAPSKVRIHIHDDSYAAQAWARAERWDGTQWHAMVSRRGEALSIEHGIGYRLRRLSHADQVAAFRADRDFLLHRTEWLLG